MRTSARAHYLKVTLTVQIGAGGRGGDGGGEGGWRSSYSVLMLCAISVRAESTACTCRHSGKLSITVKYDIKKPKTCMENIEDVNNALLPQYS